MRKDLIKNKTQGAMSFGMALSPLGLCCLAFSDNGLHALIFPKDEYHGVADLKKRFRNVNFDRDNEKAAIIATLIFEKKKQVNLIPIGTEFQLRVWNELKKIPSGEVTTYSAIAQQIGSPKAMRAVGTAIGANPIAWLIPCHRVIRSDGGLGGYRWGVELKKKMLAQENKTFPLF